MSCPASAIDLKHRIIPDAINLPGAVLVYPTAVAAQPDRWVELLVGGLARSSSSALAWLIYPAGMGLGDVKMTLMIGLALGRYAGVALFAAFTLSLLPSLALLLLKGPRGRKFVPLRAVPGRRRDGRAPVGAAALERWYVGT